MAAAGASAASLRLVPLFHFLLVILSHPEQSASTVSSGNAAFNPPSYEELSSSLVVNQLAILQILQDTANATIAAVETCRQEKASLENEARTQAARVEEALNLHLERVVEAVAEGQQRRQQEALEAINSKISTTAQDTHTRVTEMREEIRQDLDKILEEVHQPEEEAPTPKPAEEEVPVHYATWVHNDTLPSLCSGQKFLLGSIGALEVVKSGTYSSGLLCSWNITLPVKAPLSLKWDYIDTEDQSSCNYDWVKVDDLSRGATSVYGGKLCGTPGSSVLNMLNVVLPPTKNILVSFRSDGSNEKRGFRLNYHVPAQ